MFCFILSKQYLPLLCRRNDIDKVIDIGSSTYSSTLGLVVADASQRPVPRDLGTRVQIFLQYTISSLQSQLAPSPRVLAYIARRAWGTSPCMALTVSPTLLSPPLIDEKDELKPPPKVAITPCNPWPRPYYLDDGLRKVYPYHFTYNTYCKERWRGRELLEIFATEFRDRPQEYYVCIVSGTKSTFRLTLHRRMLLNAARS